jgi:hypothetical protein
MEITMESVFTDRKELCDEVIKLTGMRRKLVRLVVIATVSASLYGVTMGFFHSGFQAVASAVKTPLLFLATLFICLPALHFVGLLFGSRVRLSQSAVVLMTGACQTSILLGTFAPISLFFLLSKSTYAFLLIMHVLVFAFCGVAGLVSVYRDFTQIRSSLSDQNGLPFADSLLKVWMLLYMFVGTQMAYNLAPFINREGPVTMFNQLGGNFYSYIWYVIQGSIGG